MSGLEEPFIRVCNTYIHKYIYIQHYIHILYVHSNETLFMPKILLKLCVVYVANFGCTDYTHCAWLNIKYVYYMTLWHFINFHFTPFIHTPLFDADLIWWWAIILFCVAYIMIHNRIDGVARRFHLMPINYNIKIWKTNN